MKAKLSFILVFFTWAFVTSSALAWTVSPVRFEVRGEKGREYTLTFSVLNESQLYQKRFEVQADDWIIDKENEFLRKAFNKNINVKYSATPWIKVSPQQFVLPPGENKKIRFTVSIPPELPSDGDYTTGIFVGEKNIEKPMKGEKVVHIKQDTYIGVIVYVKIGSESSNIALKDFKVDTKPAGKGLNKIILRPLYENKGNTHARGQLTVKVEPQSGDEKIKEFNAGELVVLRESELTYPIEVPTPLQTNSEWKFSVTCDLGTDKPNLVGVKKYKVPKL